MGGRGASSMSANTGASTSGGGNNTAERGHINRAEGADFVAKELNTSKTDAESMVYAASLYSSDQYRAIRKFQQTGEGSTRIKEVADNLEKYIERAPKWNGGTTYRGIKAGRTYKVGQKIDQKGTASWSSSENVTYSFAGAGKGATIFVSSSQKRGTSITHLSRVPHEKEIVVSKDANYTVTKVENRDGIQYVYVDEI